ncbi:MAG: pyruvate:ferredoxin (flavodoxin) oxidoreductase [Gemmataceae bacterium]|nr:pyruvate:ferredoxin (flavodoxin) oxidoreductase [Gemmataceae bacterium]
MMSRSFATLDGNEAAALVAHQLNEVIAIYPITPASPMGEFADAWSQAGRRNIFGDVPQVIEMQSEAGAAGVCHGSLQGGALTTTFTASQGLLLMIPNMYKIAGELTATVFHIACRAVATHALSIFGDHSDAMACRQTGWAMLFGSSVQEAHDFAAIAQAATLQSRVPFLHCLDGFRTSHEVNKIELLSADDLRSFIDPALIRAHRERGLNPDRPVLRGTAQNPDVFFQAREACNPYYEAVPGIVREVMQKFAALTGRRYRLFEYYGAPDAERVIVLMGSGLGAVQEAVDFLTAKGERVGVLAVKLFRPFDVSTFLEALPRTVRRIAVLDRCKEPGALGEPLFLDVMAALAEHWPGEIPRVIGGRYGLSSKEFTPSMVAAIYRELAKEQPKKRFTVGIIDDVSGLSLDWDPDEIPEPADVCRAVFYGLGSDGTVGANKNSVKIIGENTPLFAQGYFVYDSKKSGAMTVSHLRFGPRPIRSTYLIRRASFVACHQFHFLDRLDVLELAEPGATFLLNSPYPASEVWDRLPVEIQQTIIDKRLKFYVVDGYRVAAEAGLEGRFNTIMQTCFFALSGVLPREEAVRQIKEAIKKTYGKRGQAVLEKNFAAVDRALEALQEVSVPGNATSKRRRVPIISGPAPDFVEKVTAVMMAGKGDLLPVSALPVDGTFPTGTARFEKRSIATEIPIWDADLCIQCGLCAFICPHAAIRTKAYPAEALNNGKPDSFVSRPWRGSEFPGHHMTVQVLPDDCTGCRLCVEICPARSKEVVKHKAINMEPKDPHLARERANAEFFLKLPELDRRAVKLETVKGTQLLEPLFEASGACAGCGETPYLKLMTQLFGDRMLVTNATGCSSIYGGNLPTTPWSPNAEGRGPAWSNSLFEDNAEFGLGLRMALDHLEERARQFVKRYATLLGDSLTSALLAPMGSSEAAVRERRQQVAELKRRLRDVPEAEAQTLVAIADHLVRRSVWIVGGDGWAYDIGFGGLDHVLSTGRDVNIVVLDTEVYSNTGGQASKATPRAAVAKFAAGGKAIGKKDLGMIAMAYGNVYVAQVALGANPLQTVKAFQEAESYHGPSLLICYSHCIAHGIDMSKAVDHQKDAVATGYWPLFRYDPRHAHSGERPFRLDSGKPTKKFRDYAMKEARFGMLAGANPAQADRLLELAQADIEARWRYYEQLAGLERQAPGTLEVVA